MNVENPKFDLGDVVKTDQGRSMVLRRDFSESVNLHGRAFEGWLYICAPFVITDKKKVRTYGTACHYTAAMLELTDEVNVMPLITATGDKE